MKKFPKMCSRKNSDCASLSHGLFVLQLLAMPVRSELWTKKSNMITTLQSQRNQHRSALQFSPGIANLTSCLPNIFRCHGTNRRLLLSGLVAKSNGRNNSWNLSGPGFLCLPLPGVKRNTCVALSKRNTRNTP